MSPTSPSRSPVSPASDQDHTKHLGTKVGHVLSSFAKKKTATPTPKLLPLLGKSLDSSCIVKKQLIHLESAINPKSSLTSGLSPPDPSSRSPEGKRSPRLIRKPKPLLSKSQTVDVSDMDLDVDPELAVFLKTRKEKASVSDDEEPRQKKSTTPVEKFPQ